MIDQVRPHLGKLAALALAVEWIFFGSLHFTRRELTEVQIPDFIPFKTAIVGITGMIEVATGILILLPKTRKWAAFVSLVLLVLFLPAIHKLLVNDAAISSLGAWRDFWRVLLVPNHVFLALCAIHLLRQSDGVAIGLPQFLKNMISRQRDPNWGAATLVVASVMLLANIAGFVPVLTSPWHHATASLWAMMCLATGALVGFLFGVPRVNRDAAKTMKYRPNSNIVAVSDWLTKILVGVGLIEFRKIGTFLNELSDRLGNSLPTQSTPQSDTEARSFALALIVYFFIAGIIQGYLLTRMYLGRSFADNERDGATQARADGETQRVPE